MPFLTVRVKGTEGYSRHNLGKERTVVGRASACDLAVPTTNISREHCLVVKKEDGWWVEDLNSSNGTWVNKEKLEGPRKLIEKDIIKAGAARLTFHEGEVSEVSAIEVAASADEDEPVDGLAAAVACPTCGLWISVAHRERHDAAACPRCSGEIKVH